jgi:AcrR family transcriptional regulator
MTMPTGSTAETPRRRLPRAERRQQILEVALEQFARDGYSESSIDRLAAAAGVTPPVLYQHFASKQDLFLAVLAAQLTLLAQAIGAADDPSSASLEQRLIDAAHAVVGFATERPSGWRLLRRTPPAEPRIAAAYREIRLGMRRRTAETTQRDPDFSPPPGVGRRVAAEFFGELQWTAFEALGDRAATDQELTDEALVRVFMDFIWVGLQQFRQGNHWQPPATMGQ